MAGYTADNPPRYVVPLLDEYDDVEVDSCGYRKGKWVDMILEDGTTVQFQRAITNDIEIKEGASGIIKTYQVKADNVAKRDENIGEVLQDELGGYNSLREALEEHEEVRVR